MKIVAFFLGWNSFSQESIWITKQTDSNTLKVVLNILLLWYWWMMTQKKIYLSKIKSKFISNSVFTIFHTKTLLLILLHITTLVWVNPLLKQCASLSLFRQIFGVHFCYKNESKTGKQNMNHQVLANHLSL
jgi:hypothetical protein